MISYLKYTLGVLAVKCRGLPLVIFVIDLRRLTIVFRFSSTLTFDGFKKAK